MNEEIKSEILEHVGDVAAMTKEGIMKAVEVMQEQAPELVREVLAWHFCKSLLLFVAGIVAIGLLVVAVKSTKKNWATIYRADGEIFCFMGCGILLGIGIGMVTTNITWLQIWIAPRLFLLEYVSDLIS